MKYKNIISAIHNFGHSFLSDENYVDSDFVFDELNKISKKKYDIKIDWKTKEFTPKVMASSRISKSIEFWHNNINEHFKSQKVDFELINEFELIWKSGEKPKVLAIDDRGKTYEKEITKTH